MRNKYTLQEQLNAFGDVFQYQLAADYGISSNISLIVNKKIWKE